MKPVAVDAFCRLKFLSQISYSPEGGSAAFALTEIDQKKDEYKSYLYLYRNKKFLKLIN